HTGAAGNDGERQGNHGGGRTDDQGNAGREGEPGFSLPESITGGAGLLRRPHPLIPSWAAASSPKTNFNQKGGKVQCRETTVVSCIYQWVRICESGESVRGWRKKVTHRHPAVRPSVTHKDR